MTTTDEAITIIRTGALTAGNRAVSEVLRAAEQWRPAGFETSQRRRKDHYTGNAQKHVREVLLRIFPKTGQHIPILPLSLMRLHASTTASFYDEQPERVLVNADTGEDIGEDDEDAKAFGELVKQSRATVKLPEAERRAVATHQIVIAVRIRHELDPVTQALKPVVRFESHFAYDAWVVPSDDAPTDLQQAYAFVLRVAGHSENGIARQIYEVWTRPERKEGSKEPGAWEFSIEDSSGKRLAAPQKYEGKLLPFALMRNEDPDAMPFIERGDDDLDVIEVLEADQADELYLGLMQAHTDRVYKGTRTKGMVVGGPDTVTTIDTGEELTTLDYNPKLEDRRTGLQQRLKLWAMTNRESADSYAVDAQVPESGVARAIKNAPTEKMRQEREALFVEFEERELWPVAAECYSLFVDDARDLRKYRFRCTPRRKEGFEDPTQRQARAQADLDRGIISLARYAVECGRYKSIDEAKKAGLPDTLKAAQAQQDAPAGGQPMRSPFAQRLEQQRAARGEKPGDVPPLEAAKPDDKQVSNGG